MSNKSLGTAFENELAEMLHERGFWVHLLRQTEAGQPADMIACRDGHAFLIDAKECSHDKFVLTRIEENQELSMKLFASTGNHGGWFALKLSDGVYFLPLTKLLMYEAWGGAKTIKGDLIRKRAFTFDEWLNEWGLGDDRDLY